jgi:hypothetical protein
MTRINLVPPEELTQQHLIAEYKELPRVFKKARRCNNPPDSYRMGTGHMKFFYDKLEFLIKRQQSLVDECLKRGYNIQHTDVESLRDLVEDKSLFNDYEPTPEALAISRARIQDRLDNPISQQKKAGVL